MLSTRFLLASFLLLLAMPLTPAIAGRTDARSKLDPDCEDCPDKNITIFDPSDGFFPTPDDLRDWFQLDDMWSALNEAQVAAAAGDREAVAVIRDVRFAASQAIAELDDAASPLRIQVAAAQLQGRATSAAARSATLVGGNASSARSSSRKSKTDEVQKFLSDVDDVREELLALQEECTAALK